MKAIAFAIIAFISAVTFGPQASATIFGSDDRRELVLQPDYQDLAGALAMWVSPVYYKVDSLGLQLDFPVISSTDSENLCPSERFSAQPANPIACTGFLIAPDLLVTAGHCMAPTGGTQKNERSAGCSDFDWVFDYAASNVGSVNLNNLPLERLVRCQRVIYATNNPDYDPKTRLTKWGDDFALIQLDRPLKGRPIFKLSKRPVQAGDPLMLMGYPSGLPAKIHPGRVLSLPEKGFFRTSLDAFGGESGGPVLNIHKEVVGILVRGFPDADYVDDTKRNCRRVNTCRPDGTGCIESDQYKPGTEVQTLEGLNRILQELG